MVANKKATVTSGRLGAILLVEQRGLEPLASALRTRRSAKLSYCPTPTEEYSFEFGVSSFEFESADYADYTEQRAGGRKQKAERMPSLHHRKDFNAASIAS
jgi:hypothetical protein